MGVREEPAENLPSILPAGDWSGSAWAGPGKQRDALQAELNRSPVGLPPHLPRHHTTAIFAHRNKILLSVF